MSLFRRAPRPAPRPVLATRLTTTDIDQITTMIEERFGNTAQTHILHGTLTVRGNTVSNSVTDLRRSGYIINIGTSYDYSFTVTGWDANHSRAGALTVAELDERIDHLLKLRQRAEAANHLTTPVE